MADGVTIGSANGVIVSSEEVTSIDGNTVTARQAQRIIPMFPTSSTSVVSGTGLAHRLDPVNDGITNYVFGHSYNNITTSATVTAKSGSGVVRGILVGDPGSTWQIQLFDNTAGSGTSIGIIKLSASGFIGLEVAFSTGLTAVTSGTTAGNCTLIYR